jgi:hypothetical protein
MNEEKKLISSDWSDFSIKKKKEEVAEWSLKDFVSYIRELYYQKYFTSIALAPAFTNMELSKLRDIMNANVILVKKDINILMKEYIDWYFDFKIYQDHVRMKNWSLKNINKPQNISAFLVYKGFGKEAVDIKDKKLIKSKKSVSSFVLKKYINGDEKIFIKDYGIIVPFAYLVSAHNFDWPSAMSYIKRGVKKCIDSSVSLDYIVDTTNTYGPYDRFKKLDMPGLLSSLSSEFNFPFEKVRLFSNVRENMEN